MSTQKKAFNLVEVVKSLLSRAGTGLESLGAGTARVANRVGVKAPLDYATGGMKSMRPDVTNNVQDVIPAASPIHARLRNLGIGTAGAGLVGAGGLAYGGSKLLGGGGEPKEAAEKRALDIRALVSRLAAKVGGGVRSATGPGSILRDMAPGTLMGAAVGAGTGALTADEGQKGRGALLGAAGGGALSGGASLLGANLVRNPQLMSRLGLEPTSGSTRAIGQHLSGAALGAAGGAIASRPTSKKPEKKEEGGEKKEPEKKEPASEKKEAALGTAFTDGFLVRCMQYGLDGEQVATMLEKGAGMDGRMGQECKDFLDRLAKA